jgi:DnaK suppressor protein
MNNAELNEKKRNELKQDLIALQIRLKEQLAGEDGSKPVQLDQQLLGRVSRIDAIQQQEMAKANRQQTQAQLLRVEKALLAFESGDYGFCLDCDEPIGYPRLKARPDTPLCLRCQANNEK